MRQATWSMTFACKWTSVIIRGTFGEHTHKITDFITVIEPGSHLEIPSSVWLSHQQLM